MKLPGYFYRKFRDEIFGRWADTIS